MILEQSNKRSRRWGDGSVFDGASITPSLSPKGYAVMALVGLLVGLASSMAFVALDFRPALIFIIVGAFVFSLAWCGARGYRW